jgi:hypothetical protein
MTQECRTRGAGGAVSALLVLLAMVFAGAPSSAAENARADDDLITRLKVAYLYNFTRFVEWPQRSVGEYFVIAVIGDPDMAQALTALEREERQAQGRPIRVRALAGPEQSDDCQILFIGAAAADDLPQLRARVGDGPVLLVGDSPGLARGGVAINFFLQPDILGAGKRLRFEINPAALKRRGLEISAQLYDVAEIVR